MESLLIKPSHFKGDYIADSVFKKCEYEQIFMNMLVVSERLGDDWGLTKEQYESERKKDGAYSSLESQYADEVLPYMASPERAQTFSVGLGKRYCELIES